jgi:DNA primase
VQIYNGRNVNNKRFFKGNEIESYFTPREWESKPKLIKQTEAAIQEENAMLELIN